ncbi:MAG: EAL domain-containing protein [Fibromonadaceae bacterium]|jgi:EAL domain-containing protein (putative c-di-GMP-specific phosphodiesterase class I)|nr:EAL domain-containing protein [Fibromonadaceae bacterium]
MNISPEKVVAYFQPILSADSKTVYSYEILGRYIDDEGAVHSLGPFFNDLNTTNEEALQVDRLVRRYALKKYAEEKRSEYLFINIRLAWLTQFTDRPDLMLTLKWAEEFGIALEKLVIEITEEEFNASNSYIRAVLHYKGVGCRIALDDYGKNASDIDRLAEIKPDIIKIDMDYIHKSEKSYYYREYLRSIADFAESVGIEVLYEGIETREQLDICTALKGRFYQGFLIAHPQASMSDAVIDEAIFSESIENLYTVLQDEIAKTETLRKSLDTQIEHFLAENPFDSEKNYNEYLAKLCQELSNVWQIYLCDSHGNQLTPNIASSKKVRPKKLVFRKTEQELYENKNWVWRGYFHDALKSVASGQRSSISSIYHDFSTKDKVRTYSYSISNDIFLFVDIE